MTADQMANFHENMAAWCREQINHLPSTEPTSYAIMSSVWMSHAVRHDRAFQYWRGVAAGR